MQATRTDPARIRRGQASNAALDAALVSGGDARLAIDPVSRLNAYGCQPSPRPAEISLSSSTASTVSGRGYAAAGTAFALLREARARDCFAPAFAYLADDVRAAIRAQFDLPQAEVVLSPSGTDGALLALFLARGVLGRPVTSIVVAADESGNGVPAAASGRHFGATASGGGAVPKGEPIAGLACATVAVPLRDAHGVQRPPQEIDAEVRRAAASAIRAGQGVVLHVMDHSKLGSRGPSLACVDEIRALAPSAVQVVVDACQARLGRGQLRRYLDQGFLVLITGSKFFTGPPLSGALLAPQLLWDRIDRIADIPAGLADYTARDDWPSCFGRIRDELPARQNVGPVLRWIAAIEDIRAYFEVPALFRKLALAEFASAVTRHVARFSELALLPEAALSNAGLAGDRDGFAVRTIFPFTVTHRGRPLSFTQARVLHQALNRDLATHGLGCGDDTAATLCHLGQPVAVPDGSGGMTGALRISADARLVADSWVGAGDLASTGRLMRRIDQVGTVLEKLQSCLPHLDRLGDIRLA
ncbi:MAG TPA: hypothetical protein VGH49_04260 [Xanthobacteraceae bacterium]